LCKFQIRPSLGSSSRMIQKKTDSLKIRMKLGSLNLFRPSLDKQLQPVRCQLKLFQLMHRM